MKKILLIFCFLLFYSFAGAAPHINFTDLESGPDTGIGDSLGSGTIVTVWGQNLGTPTITSGSPPANYDVYFTDSGTNKRSAAYIYYWCNADGGTSGGGPSDLYTSHKMQEIAFSIPDSDLGAGTITVEVNEVESNTLPFTTTDPATYKIYYFASDGSDSNDGSFNSEWANPYWGNTTSAGPVYVNAGDVCYAKDVTRTSMMRMSTATVTYDGTEAAPFALIAYPGTEFNITVDDSVGIKSYTGNPSSYWVFSKVNIVTNDTGFTNMRDTRLIGTAVTDNTCAEGVSAAIASSGGNTYLGNWVHDWGGDCNNDNYHHVSYFTNRTGELRKGHTVAWCRFNDNTIGATLHLYDLSPGGSYSSDVTWHHNVLIDNALTSIHMDHSSWTNSFNMYVYSNLIVGSGSQHGVVTPTDWTRSVWWANGITTPIYFYNNTVIDTGRGVGDPGHIVFQPNGGGEWTNRNNVFITQDSSALTGSAYTTGLQASTNNSWWDTDESFTEPSWDDDATQILTDPKITNYIPDSDSPLLDSGYDTSSTIGLYDLYGNPFGAPDIGAIGTGSTSGATEGISRGTVLLLP